MLLNFRCATMVQESYFLCSTKEEMNRNKDRKHVKRKCDFIKSSVEDGSVEGIELEVKPVTGDVENEM
jgi:hypothetical protein